MASGQGHHGRGGGRDGPEVEVLGQVVDEGDTAADAAGRRSERQGRGSGQGSSEADDLVEEHFERVVVIVCRVDWTNEVDKYIKD